MPLGGTIGAAPREVGKLQAYLKTRYAVALTTKELEQFGEIEPSVLIPAAEGKQTKAKTGKPKRRRGRE
jgi:hypothetical protein